MLTVDPNNGDIAMDRGDYFDPVFTIYDPVTGLPKDCTGGTFTLTVKASLDDPIEAAIFQLTSAAAQFDLSGIAAGIVQALGPETLSLALAGDYVYDCVMVLGGKKRTVQPSALLRFNKNVTTAGAPPAPPAVLVPFPGDIQIIGGQLYITDTGIGVNAGKSWKLVVQDGVFDVQGPSDVVPF